MRVADRVGAVAYGAVVSSADRDPRLGRVPDRLWVPAFAAGLLAALFVGGLLLRSHDDVSRLVHAGPPWTQAAGAPGSLTVLPADKAFDGQFFYRLGVAPWSTEPVVAGVRFDLPSLRNARWGYGALAFVLSGGDRDLVPWALVGLNVAAAAGVGAVAGALARDLGRHAAWGLLLALWPGFAYSLSLDTSELVASLLVLTGLLAARRSRWGAAAVLLAAAAITRDTTVVVPAGLVAAGAWTWWRDRSVERDRGPLVAGGVPLAVFAGWQLLQRSRYGALPLTSSGDNNLAAPLAGLAHQLAHVLPPSGGAEALRLVSMVTLVVLVGAAAVAWRTSATPLHERVAWVPAVLVVVLLNSYLWSGATAFMRASTEAGLLSSLVLLGSRRRWTDLAAVPVVGLWLLTVVAQVGKAG
ncbi:MAG: hypothetical protein JWN46_3254 [Acidimicrobiales bacterium]|nr:hypothetical protein [Acidimicrobiales bacterium]